ncbi:hypothetical protein [Dyadobacter fermentans]|uniref:Outer membrane protein beta-barrel domain-containing protein n=1 Tax=Dyadobacter fermentans (strain ATCC 700827 / DSM 18053 / CIP 107007 / KCTC 52180 / NS114) TaxID=471854 RepID=C6W694_DYAFD|nr:hypothetical protein [Dyadobacter fermentans]ACT92574.1 conserved hypothetical protein [Dyadobacter fermentans DSM 18053]
MKQILVSAALLVTGAAGAAYAQSGQKLVPDFAQLQYAGSIGWMGVGAGYEFFNRRVRTHLQYGYVPPDKGGRLHLLSGAVFYQPVRIKAGARWEINPLDIGFKASYQFGNNYFFNLPSRYPPNYYWWKPALRMHLATESSITRKLRRNASIRSVSAYLEFNTNDLYLVSYVLNAGSLRVTEVVKAGLGIRVGF